LQVQTPPVQERPEGAQSSPATQSRQPEGCIVQVRVTVPSHPVESSGVQALVQSGTQAPVPGSQSHPVAAQSVPASSTPQPLAWATQFWTTLPSQVEVSGVQDPAGHTQSPASHRRPEVSQSSVGDQPRQPFPPATQVCFTESAQRVASAVQASVQVSAHRAVPVPRSQTCPALVQSVRSHLQQV
jgi:hypothetical protein